jgi:hypothetical protein
MLTLHSKPSLDDFIKTCTPLLRIPELETKFAERVDKIADSLMGVERVDDPVQALVRFLRADDDFLGVILALTNLSQEKFLRVLTANRFVQQDYGTEWKVDTVLRRVKREDSFAEMVANLFLEGRGNALLQQVADFYLAQLELPRNWQSLIVDDPTVVKSAIRRKLSGEYADAKGKSVEDLVRKQLERIRDTYGVGFAHGQVSLVQKEVDFAIPSVEDPHVMIMVSYMETTSSSQTARANEQQAMYEKVIGANVRYGTMRALVNVVDGGGWLARRSDLRKLHSGCTYALNVKSLDQLEAIVCHHVPASYFTTTPKPSINVLHA